MCVLLVLLSFGFDVAIACVFAVAFDFAFNWAFEVPLVCFHLAFVVVGFVFVFAFVLDFVFAFADAFVFVCVCLLPCFVIGILRCELLNVAFDVCYVCIVLCLFL